MVGFVELCDGFMVGPDSCSGSSLCSLVVSQQLLAVLLLPSEASASAAKAKHAALMYCLCGLATLVGQKPPLYRAQAFQIDSAEYVIMPKKDTLASICWSPEKRIQRTPLRRPFKAHQKSPEFLENIGCLRWPIKTNSKKANQGRHPTAFHRPKPPSWSPAVATPRVDRRRRPAECVAPAISVEAECDGAGRKKRLGTRKNVDPPKKSRSLSSLNWLVSAC